MKKYMDTPNIMSRTMFTPWEKMRGGTEEGCTEDLSSVSNLVMDHKYFFVLFLCLFMYF